MREQVLKKFFCGEASVEELLNDVKDTFIRKGIIGHHPIKDMEEDYKVTSIDLLKLCDAVLAGHLEPEYLEPIGFCLLASSHFHWDGDDPDGYRVSEVVHEWSCPAVNYPLTRGNVQLWKRLLETGCRTFNQ